MWFNPPTMLFHILCNPDGERRLYLPRLKKDALITWNTIGKGLVQAGRNNPPVKILPLLSLLPLLSALMENFCRVGLETGQSL
jgi:hypothetical protein